MSINVSFSMYWKQELRMSPTRFNLGTLHWLDLNMWPLCPGGLSHCQVLHPTAPKPHCMIWYTTVCFVPVPCAIPGEHLNQTWLSSKIPRTPQPEYAKGHKWNVARHRSQKYESQWAPQSSMCEPFPRSSEPPQPMAGQNKEDRDNSKLNPNFFC